MAKVRDQAGEEGDRVYEALALTALGEASIKRDGDAARARTLVDKALEILPHDSDAVAHFDALTTRAIVGAWLGSGDDYVRFMERAYVKALDAERRDLQTIAAQALASAHIMRLELEEAEILLDARTRACRRERERPGSHQRNARLRRLLEGQGRARCRGDDDGGGPGDCDRARPEPVLAASLLKLGWLARAKADLKLSEKLFREALRITAARGDRGLEPDSRLRWPRLWPSWGRSTKESGLR